MLRKILTIAGTIITFALVIPSSNALPMQGGPGGINIGGPGGIGHIGAPPAIRPVAPSVSRPIAPGFNNRPGAIMQPFNRIPGRGIPPSFGRPPINPGFRGIPRRIPPPGVRPPIGPRPGFPGPGFHRFPGPGFRPFPNRFPPFIGPRFFHPRDRFFFSIDPFPWPYFAYYPAPYYYYPYPVDYGYYYPYPTTYYKENYINSGTNPQYNETNPEYSDQGVTKEVPVEKIVKEEKPLFVFPDEFFDFDKSTLRPGAMVSLNEVAKDLKEMGYPDIILSGHTDIIGSAEYNQKLSERRANSVAKYLEEKGVPADKIKTIGYGKTKPIATDKTAAGRQQNRRVELRLANP